MWNQHVHTAIFKKDNQQGPTVQHRELCLMLWGSLGVPRGVWGRMDPCICMAEPLPCSPETVIALLIGYTPVQNEKLKKKDLAQGKFLRIAC